ncbi:MAG: M28 family peptidase [Bacteroidetes bacterium]|nr:M28 family peptidase [Bacteroidota bacterium]
MRYKNPVIILIFFTSLFFSCIPGEEKKAPDEKASLTEVSTPLFNSDTAYLFIREQLAFGSRVPNTPAHDSCASYLTDLLKNYGADVTVQKTAVTAFNGSRLNIQNIIGSYLPYHQGRILLCAHWDTRPFADNDTAGTDTPIPGASDGASGVAVLLEIARLFKAIPPPVGVDIIFFDAEDFGSNEISVYENRYETYCLGSQYWAQNPHRPGYHARYGILLDMVGAKGAQFVQENISLRYAPDIVEKVWNTAAGLGYSDIFVFQRASFLGADDHLYINRYAKIPTIDIIHFDPGTKSGFPSWHHTHRDDLPLIDKNTLKAVGQTLLEVVYGER